MKTKSGFTIVELLIVIVVVATLAAVTVVAYSGVQQRARNSALAGETNNVSKKIELFKVGGDTYPSSITACPTPGAGEICHSFSPGTTVDYRATFAGGTGYMIALDNSYEVAIMSDAAFLFTGKTERTGGNEFMQYADLAPFIDRYGLKKYELSFDIKSANTANRSLVQVYFQNGSTTRYGGLSQPVTVTTEYVRHTLVFTPTNGNMSVTNAMLAFYGTYGSGNRPIVRNVQVRLAQ